jgi:signal transduction histidine kinase
VVRIDFAAPTLAPNAAARFRYRLEPQDRDWVSARGEKFAFYTNVKPGTYRFRVQAINPDGNFAEAESVAFVFVPHFYQRPLFFAGAAAALLVIGISIHAGRLRVQRRILRLEQQNALEKERSRIAADIHDALGSELSRIALLSERLRRGEVADESAAAGAISQTARDMGTNLSELIWATNAHNDTLDNLASYLRTHAATQCDSAGLRLDGAVDEIPPCPVSGLVRHNLYLIFREALTNVLKHAQASVVRLDISFRDGLLEITLEDNGCGFPPELASRGNGQANLRRRAAEIGADISISSGPSGNGTRVRLLWQPPARNESRCT